MASERQLKSRMKSVTNIKKITKAMKMVAAAKLRRSQEALEQARDFAKAMTEVWPDIEAKSEEGKVVEAKNRALIGVTSDKGLCGAVNSVVIRSIKHRLNALSSTERERPPSVVTFGEKARAGLERLFKDFFLMTITEQSKNKRLSFKQVALVTDDVNELNLGDSLLIYNYFKSMLSYETRSVPWASFDTATSKPEVFQQYEIEGDNDFWRNFWEFRNAVRFYHFFAESETSELSSRMNAMGGSAKNAGEMLDKLKLKYNRTRQARITTELIEIISGAVALEG